MCNKREIQSISFMFASHSPTQCHVSRVIHPTLCPPQRDALTSDTLVSLDFAVIGPHLSVTAMTSDALFSLDDFTKRMTGTYGFWAARPAMANALEKRTKTFFRVTTVHGSTQQKRTDRNRVLSKKVWEPILRLRPCNWAIVRYVSQRSRRSAPP